MRRARSARALLASAQKWPKEPAGTILPRASAAWRAFFLGAPGQLSQLFSYRCRAFWTKSNSSGGGRKMFGAGVKKQIARIVAISSIQRSLPPAWIDGLVAARIDAHLRHGDGDGAGWVMTWPKTTTTTISSRQSRPQRIAGGLSARLRVWGAYFPGGRAGLCPIRNRLTITFVRSFASACKDARGSGGGRVSGQSRIKIRNGVFISEGVPPSRNLLRLNAGRFFHIAAAIAQT